MSVSLLLTLALVGSPGGTPQGGLPARSEIVRAVRIEAEQAERLRAFVGLKPGDPLDREQVRRAVELIVATGRFADVPVELVHQPGGAGVTVVFRPRPAPLLVAVRVEGDRVLSPKAVAQAARLRPREALWPARLDRAARDVALALARRGYLEAFVDRDSVRVRGGADAVFRVRAGPQVHLGSIAIRGWRGLPAPVLEPLRELRAGDIYRKQTADTAAERTKRNLVDAGYWRARVEPRETYDPGRGLMQLAFEVDAGPRLRVETRGAAVPQGLLAAVRGLIKDGAVSQDALATGTERIETHLRKTGYRDALVRVTLEASESGEKVVYDLQPGARAIAASVELRGADPILLRGLRTRAGRPIQDAVLEGDRRLLLTRLAERGHFEARVESDVPDGGGALPVVFLATPGPRALVKEVTVEGPALPSPAEEGRLVELPLRPGQPYRLVDLARSRELLTSAWRRAGYLDAVVHPEVAMSAGRDEARIRLVVEPGVRTLVDHVVLAGLGRTDPRAVGREMVLRPGQPFSFERVLESQRRLTSLGIFERVSISELDPVSERRDVVVNVQEAPATTVFWGVGYSEQDRLRGSVELALRNLGGLARTASLFARGSFRGSRFQLNLREPWLFGKKLDSFLTGFWEEESRTTFGYNRRGGIFQVGRTFDPRTSLILRYLLQDTNVYDVKVPIDEIDRQYRTYTVSGPSASVVFDTRDDPLEPKRGLFLSADLQLSLAALGGESFLRGFLQATGVRSLRSDLVFVLSGRLGLANAFDSTSALLPLPERFFAGGDFGPRGFPVDGVGPQVLASNGGLYPIGGNALLLGGAEMRYNLTRAFQLASFLDVGNVYVEPGEIDVGSLRRSAGVGLRYRTPIGPIRLDWGYVLDHREGESRSHFHLTIGHAF